MAKLCPATNTPKQPLHSQAMATLMASLPLRTQLLEPISIIVSLCLSATDVGNAR